MNDDLVLGNLSKRLTAGIIDYAIIWTITILMIFSFGHPVPGKAGSYQLTGWPSFYPCLLWFVMTVLIEQLFGATLGNAVVSLKPIDING
jgi:uncharacterized RDD family membrane protein YckC